MHTKGDDIILPSVRSVAAVIVVVLVLAVVVLYGVPGQTNRWWAWAVRPPMTPMLMGAGYAAGAYFFLRVLFVPRWHRVALGFLPIGLFTTCMGFATLMHWDRFLHDHFAFWAWAGLYFVTPVLVPALWLLNRNADGGMPEPDDVMVPTSIRAGLAIAGAAILVLAFLMIVRPSTVIGDWPWALTPLSTRVVGSFLALTGASLLAIAGDQRWSAGKTMLEALIVGTVLILAAVPRAWDTMKPDDSMRWLFVAGIVAQLVVLLGVYGVMEMRRRRPVQVATPQESVTAS